MIEIWTEELPSGWEWNPYKYCGGTQEFIVNTAECLGGNAIVYYDGEPCEKNGVWYLPRKSFIGNDIVLSCNSFSPRKGRYNIYWTNWYHQRQSNCMDFDERIVLSTYHQSIFGYDSIIVGHSCWPEKLRGGKKVKGRCLYSSSPDRGLSFLKSIWHDVSRETGAELISTYDKDISEENMNELYKSSQFWLHPGQGVELFCISAVKAQVAGCIPVVVPNMALDTTVKYGIKTTLDKYKDDLIDTINNPSMIENVDFGDWDTVTKELFKNVNTKNLLLR